MLQASDYRVVDYLKWFWTNDDFSKTKHKHDRTKTEAAKQIYFILVTGMVLQVVAGLIIAILGLTGTIVGGFGFGLAIIVSYPVVWSQIICLPVLLDRLFLFSPKTRKPKASRL